MEPWLEILNPREWALLTWIAIAVGACIASAKIRPALLGVVKALFQPLLIAVMGVASVYIALCVWGLAELGLWSIANLKTTILWAVTFAFVTMFAVEKRAKEPHFYRRTLLDTVAVTTLLTFVVEFYTFGYIGELVLIPILTFLSLLYEFAKHKTEHKPVERLLGGVLAGIGLSYLGYAAYQTFLAPTAFFTWDNAQEFWVPTLLSALFLPFLYVLAIYVVYERVFAVMVNPLPDRALRRYAKRKAIWSFGRDIGSVDRWRHLLFIDKPTHRSDIDRMIEEVRVMKERDASPATVPTNQGWSPPLATQFLSDHGLATLGYSRIDGDDWHGSSPPFELGNPNAIWRNRLGYYVAGKMDKATQLTLKLYLNAPQEAECAENKFREAALALVEAALGPGTVARLNADIGAFAPMSITLPNGELSLEKGDGITPVTGSYSRILRVKRNHHESFDE